MLKKILLAVIASLSLVPVSMAAQDHPTGEIFGGYSFLRSGGVNAHGWNASLTPNFKDWLGVKMDFSGFYKNGGQVYTFLFGPQFSYRKQKRVTPFVHTLFGGIHAHNGRGETAFGMALGGGLDINAARHVAGRVIQADYLMSRFGGQTQNSARLSFGVVFQFYK